MFQHFNCKGCGANCIGMPHDPEHVQQGFCSEACAGGERKVYARAALRVHLRQAGNEVPDCSVHLWRVDETCDECRETLAPFAPQVRAGGFASFPLNLGEVRVVVEESDRPLADLLAREGHRPHRYDFREFEAANGLPVGSLGEQEDEEGDY